MTDYTKAKINKRLTKYIKESLFVIPTVISILLSVLFAPYILIYVNEGLRLCFNVIIGSVFPFMIITDIIMATTHFERIDLLRKVFEHLFKINGYAISAFIIGIVCGFPLGVKVSIDLYRCGCISKDECERLIGFCNNTGPAFIISGIGVGMRGSICDGVILYFSMIFSAIICGLISGRNKKISCQNTNKANLSFEFSTSVKAAALNTLYICAFIVFFSIVCGFLDSIIKNELMYSAIIPFIEISNSAKILSQCKFFTRNIQMILTSFAISFSGISVHMQAKSFIIGTDISMITYYKTKLLQGVISALITSLLVIIK